jgi:hypothetical protein
MMKFKENYKSHFLKHVNSCVMRLHAIITCFVFFILLNNCTPKKLPFEKLNLYLQDESNGVKKTQVIGDFTYTLTYKPHDLLVWQELQGNKNIKDTLLNRLKSKYEKYDYYILNIKAGDKDVLNGASSNMQMFSQNLQTLSFHMADYTYAVTEKKDTLYLADFHFPRLYGMGGGTQVILAYNKDKEPGSYTDIFLDDIGVGTGRQVFRFKKEDIEKIPMLEFEI